MTPQDQWLLQKERVLAWMRLGFAVVAIAVIQVNPARVVRFPALSYLSLGSFLFYSLVIVYLSRRDQPDSRKIGLITTSLDLIWVSLIVFSTGAAQTPFFVFYFFPVITASSRYGIKGGLTVASVGVALYGFIRFNFVWETPLAIDLFITRTVYLLMLAYMFGLLSEFERKQNQKLLALSKTAGEVAALEERRRIVQELHDGLLQSLATLILRLEACRKQLMPSPDLDRELKSIETFTRSAMNEIRQFIAGNTAHILKPGTLIETLREDLKFFRDSLGLRIILECEPEEPTLPEEIERELYYVLREGLMNIARHSMASRAEVTLKQKHADLQGALIDDGVGFDVSKPRQGQGIGLMTMKERITRLGGRLSTESSPGKGTKILFNVPLSSQP
jgi:signal transduction histidine kinase